MVPKFLRDKQASLQWGSPRKGQSHILSTTLNRKGQQDLQLASLRHIVIPNGRALGTPSCKENPWPPVQDIRRRCGQEHKSPRAYANWTSHHWFQVPSEGPQSGSTPNPKKLWKTYNLQIFRVSGGNSETSLGSRACSGTARSEKHCHAGASNHFLMTRDRGLCGWSHYCWGMGRVLREILGRKPAKERGICTQGILQKERGWAPAGLGQGGQCWGHMKTRHPWSRKKGGATQSLWPYLKWAEWDSLKWFYASSTFQ